MSLAYQSLFISVLIVVGVVSSLPLFLREMYPPRSPVPLRSGLRRPGLWIVESLEGHWYINGQLKSRLDLERTLQRQSRQELVHYLPSNALSLEAVSRSMRWLRTLAPGSVVLELPPASSLSP